jgi:hypothetical protein
VTPGPRAEGWTTDGAVGYAKRSWAPGRITCGGSRPPLACWRSPRFLCGTIDKRDAAVVVDHGRVTTWEEAGRTHVKSRKKVEFSNQIDNATAGVVLGFAELNEEVAEVACCLDAGQP